MACLSACLSALSCVLYWQESLIQVEISYIIGSIFIWYAVNNFFTVEKELV